MVLTLFDQSNIAVTYVSWQSSSISVNYVLNLYLTQCVWMQIVSVWAWESCDTMASRAAASAAKLLTANVFFSFCFACFLAGILHLFTFLKDKCNCFLFEAKASWVMVMQAAVKRGSYIWIFITFSHLFHISCVHLAPWSLIRSELEYAPAHFIYLYIHFYLPLQCGLFSPHRPSFCFHCSFCSSAVAKALFSPPLSIQSFGSEMKRENVVCEWNCYRCSCATCKC